MAYLLSDQQWIRTAESEIKSDSSLDTKKTFFYLTLTLFLYTVMFLSLQILLLPFFEYCDWLLNMTQVHFLKKFC